MRIQNLYARARRAVVDRTSVDDEVRSHVTQPEASQPAVAGPSVPSVTATPDASDASESPTSVSSDRPELAEALASFAKGEVVEAVDHLVAADRRDPDPDLQVALVDLRLHAAAAVLERPTKPVGRAPWPPAYADPFPGHHGTPPEIHRDALDTEVLGGAVAHHGCLIVRGLFGPEQVDRTVDVITRARAHQRELRAEQAARSGKPAAEPAPEPAVSFAEPESADWENFPDLDPDPAQRTAWYRPVVVQPAVRNQVNRNMVADQGGVWLGDSPRAAASVLRDLADAGATGAITGHFGERPFFSLQKSTLRRSVPRHKLVAWHQDGSFLTTGVRTMNVWVALSPCGGRYPSPGLEVVPRRVGEVLPVDGELTPHSMPTALIDELAEETPTVIPEFEPGDAILFDERFVHRTHLAPDMTDIRFALECWFFAPSHHSESYAALLV